MKYTLELIPIREGRSVIPTNGRNCTLEAQRNHVVINGQKYFMARDYVGDAKAIGWLMESPDFLKDIESYVLNKSESIKITIEQRSGDEP